MIARRGHVGSLGCRLRRWVLNARGARLVERRLRRFLGIRIAVLWLVLVNAVGGLVGTHDHSVIKDCARGRVWFLALTA
jgi:hypothetical protein